jgi:hypothetical protein
MGATGERTGLGGLGLLAGFGLVGLDGLAVQDLTEQDATDEGFALLALETKLVRPGAIGERLVVEEVLRLLGVRQDFHSGAFFVFFGFGVAASGSVSSTGSPDSPMVSTKKSRGNWPKPSCLGYTFFASDSESGSTVATTVGISPPSVFPIWTLLRRVASSRAFLILSRSRAYERPTRIE